MNARTPPSLIGETLGFCSLKLTSFETLEVESSHIPLKYSSSKSEYVLKVAIEEART
jgi:hypothetical protein